MIIIIHRNGDIESHEGCRIAKVDNEIWINFYSDNIYAKCLAKYESHKDAEIIMQRFRRNCRDGKNVLEL